MRGAYAGYKKAACLMALTLNVSIVSNFVFCDTHKGVCGVLCTHRKFATNVHFMSPHPHFVAIKVPFVNTVLQCVLFGIYVGETSDGLVFNFSGQCKPLFSLPLLLCLLLHLQHQQRRQLLSVSMPVILNHSLL